LKVTRRNLTVAKQTKTDVAGTLEKPCSGNLSNAKHPVSQTLLDFTLGEVLYNPIPCQQNPHYKALEVFPAGLFMQLRGKVTIGWQQIATG
jgi:hypothetical protein